MKRGKIIIIRHGESEEDIDKNIKSLPNDPRGLTLNGISQAKETAKKLLSEYRNFEKYLNYSSSSNRVKETASIFTENIPILRGIGLVEIPAIRNLHWGNTTIENVKKIETERYKAGVLNYNFPGGDDTKIYVKNINLFCKKMTNIFKYDLNSCLTIFTHGFALRVIVKEILSITENEFKYFSNPKNCFSCILDVSIELDQLTFSLREPLPKVNFSIN